MRTTFTGIEIARRGTTAQQRSLDTVAHNVANANTPGYSRQRAVHAASNPFPMPSLAHTPGSGQVGMGVQIQEVTQMRDQFAEMRLRQEYHNLGYWQSQKDGLTQVERIFNEPSEHAVHNALDEYWNAVQDLSQDPESEAERNVVVQRAQVLTGNIRHTYKRLAGLREDVNADAAVQIDAINSKAEEIANLNREIGKIASTGNNPNDLIDKRTLLLEELSEIVDIDVHVDDVNMAAVSIGGMHIVQRGDVSRLEADNSETVTEGVNGEYRRQVMRWESTGQAADISGGRLGGMLEFRDQNIEEYMSQLNTWAEDLYYSINHVHGQGEVHPDGQETSPKEFFSFIGDEDNEAARNIQVAAHIAEDVWNIRASSQPGVEGNGENALAMAELRAHGLSSLGDAEGYLLDADGERVVRDGELVQLGTEAFPVTNTDATLGERFNAIISGLGVRAQEAMKMVETEKSLVNHLQNLKESTAGVNLDEEMADMIRFQHSYNASARMMTAMDEALETIINRMGLVGR